jgi:flagellar assembly factor FliW
MRIESEQLGPLEIPEEGIVTFPFGIPGFPTASQFCLVDVKPDSIYKLLQSTTDPQLAFVVTDPLVLDPDYPLQLVQQLACEYGLEPDEALAVAAVVSVPAPPARPSANLLAPLAMGMKSRLGVQVVLHSSPYRVRHEM